ncbi:hypothetical protein EYF80_052984 [Liparis tanakae]|uniref:Uncharacterized protein n=1 Tax=Liparis tanakae TaxID=230148 RepID=A0A4Z2F7R9_9TELE|nr:hypothetical protein EYF80_052984 [Liparis tanakae]
MHGDKGDPSVDVFYGMEEEECFWVEELGVVQWYSCEVEQRGGAKRRSKEAALSEAQGLSD